jgi:hypothetical protein
LNGNPWNVAINIRFLAHRVLDALGSGSGGAGVDCNSILRHASYFWIVNADMRRQIADVLIGLAGPAAATDLYLRNGGGFVWIAFAAYWFGGAIVLNGVRDLMAEWKSRLQS